MCFSLRVLFGCKNVATRQLCTGILSAVIDEIARLTFTFYDNGAKCLVAIDVHFQFSMCIPKMRAEYRAMQAIWKNNNRTFLSTWEYVECGAVNLHVMNISQ